MARAKRSELNSALKEKVPWSSFELRSTVAPDAAGHGSCWPEMGSTPPWAMPTANCSSTARTRASRISARIFPARTSAPLAIGNAPLELTILVDRSTVEVFAQGGRVAMTNLVYPPPNAVGMELSARGPVAVDIWELKSAWK